MLTDDETDEDSPPTNTHIQAAEDEVRPSVRLICLSMFTLDLFNVGSLQDLCLKYWSELKF